MIELIQEIERLKTRVRALERIEQPSFTWSDWTPTVTQSGSVTVTVTTSRYCVVNKILFFAFRLAVTGSGTVSNAVTIGNFPVAPANISMIGSGYIYDASAGPKYYVLKMYYTGVLIEDNATNFFGIIPAIALASGDVIVISGQYEIA